MSTQAKLLKDVPVIDIGADTPVLALDSSGAVGKGTLAETVGRWSKNVTASEIGGGNLLPYIAERRCAA